MSEPHRSATEASLTRRSVLTVPLVIGAAVSLAGCAPSSAGGSPANEIRLGYFANLTHAVPLVGLAQGFFVRSLGGVRIAESVFNAGPAATEALLSGAVDAAYLGPSPAINAYVRTKRRGVRVVAGGASAGAALVVRPAIDTPAQLRGSTLASPQLGGSQDVALRAYLLSVGLRTDTTGGHDVTVVAQQNAQSLDLFRQHAIDGAWLPEPWVSRMVLEGGAKVLIDERTLWPSGVFPTTQLLVSQAFLETSPRVVRGVLDGHVAATHWIRAHHDAAAALINRRLRELTGKALPAAVLARAFGQISVGWDPIASAARTLASNAVTAGTAPKNPDLSGLFDLRPLNGVLAAHGQPPVSGAGLEIR